MLKSLDALEEGFRNTFEKSKTECRDELEKIRQFIYIISHFDGSIREYYSPDRKTILPKYLHSLIFACYMELMRASGHILFLSCNGLYRNALYNIRYALESIVQAFYIDLRHPKTPIFTKIEILKEVEDKWEYHAGRIINELKIDQRKKFKEEYRELSRIIHPSHKQVIATLVDLRQQDEGAATIKCEEISNIYDSMKKMFDMFFFLFVGYFPEVKEALKRNPKFVGDIKRHNLILLSKALKVKLGQTQ